MKTLFNDELKEIYPSNVNKLFSKWETKIENIAFNPEKEVNKIMKDPEERCLYMMIALEWIDYHTSSAVHEDERNENAMKMIRAVKETNAYSDLHDMYFYEDPSEYQIVAGIFCENASCMHRTSMQKMSAFMLCMLSQCSKDLDKEVSEVYGKEWWKMPLLFCFDEKKSKSNNKELEKAAKIVCYNCLAKNSSTCTGCPVNIMVDNTKDTYYVSLAINARVNVAVKAKDIMEAKEKALTEFALADLTETELEVIDYVAVNVTDEDGNLTDY